MSIGLEDAKWGNLQQIHRLKVNYTDNYVDLAEKNQVEKSQLHL